MSSVGVSCILHPARSQAGAHLGPVGDLIVVSGSKAESDRRYQMHRLDGRFVFGWMALSSFFVLKPTMLVVVSRGQLA